MDARIELHEQDSIYFWLKQSVPIRKIAHHLNHSPATIRLKIKKHGVENTDIIPKCS